MEFHANKLSSSLKQWKKSWIKSWQKQSPPPLNLGKSPALYEAWNVESVNNL